MGVRADSVREMGIGNTNRNSVSFGGDVYFLKLVLLLVSQLCGYTKNH